MRPSGSSQQAKSWNACSSCQELIENSLDAGATSITITVERGGFDRLSVEDNGSGIAREDLPLALDRHATSKLRTKEDLASIVSLGFRGEALASIGMVSKLQISSKPDGQTGASIVMEDGVKSGVQPIGMAEGTVISVEHLFKNLRGWHFSVVRKRRRLASSMWWLITRWLILPAAST